MFVYLERGITYLAMDQEAKLIELRAQPDLSSASDSDFVKKAIKDFVCAIDI